jgi:hypothetical protein
VESACVCAPAEINPNQRADEDSAPDLWAAWQRATNKTAPSCARAASDAHGAPRRLRRRRAEPHRGAAHPGASPAPHAATRTAARTRLRRGIGPPLRVRACTRPRCARLPPASHVRTHATRRRPPAARRAPAALTCVCAPQLACVQSEFRDWQTAPPESWSLGECAEPLREWQLVVRGSERFEGETFTLRVRRGSFARARLLLGHLR